MYSLAQIQSMSRKAARDSARKHIVPFVLEQNDIDRLKQVSCNFPFPNIGDRTPRGWKLLETHFVDATGMGDDNEPALTPRQFANKLVAGHGYAIVEVGQFQVHVGEFEKRGG